MPLPVDDAVGHSFGLEVGGIQVPAVTRISGLTIERDVIELKQNTPDGRIVVKKLPGRPKAGEVAVTRRLTHDDTFETWVRSGSLGRSGDPAAGRASITLLDASGQLVKRYTLTGAWPKSLAIGTMRAGDTRALTEKLVIVYEAIEPR